MPRPRIAWGTRHAPVRLSIVVEEAARTRFHRLAQHAGVSSAAFFEAVVDHLETELTDRGVPDWWPQPEPKDGELPIDAP